MHSIRTCTHLSLLGAAALALVTLTGVARAQPTEAAACRSTSPGDWPASSKPYFLLAVDTSGSMDTTNASWVNSCGYDSNADGTNPNRNDAARCAMYNTVQAYAGLVNFGLMTFPTMITDATGVQPTSCNSLNSAPSNGQGCGISNLYAGGSCGSNLSDSCCVQNGNPPGSGTAPWGDSGTGADCTGTVGTLHTGTLGGNMLVGLQQDDYWNAPGSQSASNVAEILSWVDNVCGDCKELWANGATPLHGLLRDAQRYLQAGWSDPNDGTRAFSTPLTGTERGCRSVNVILLTDGAEYCEPGPNDNDPTNLQSPCASNAAADLLAGVTVGANSFSVRTHVIALGTVAGVDNIAYGGGTGRAYIANNEIELSTALAGIISSAIPPESCNNGDDNCNGCTDEGSKVWCNRNKTARTLAVLQNASYVPNPDDCCGGTSTRAACLTAFQASIDPTTNPQGDRWLLPCWNAQTDTTNPESKWLCQNPGEACDDVDNNCDVQVLQSGAGFATNSVDETFTKCPLCPVTESCNGQDDDCDTYVDNVAPPLDCGSCVPSDEICDGIDNDCDARIDEGLAPIPCGLLTSSNPACQGVQICAEQPNPSGLPGGTAASSNGWSSCSDSPGATDVTCDGVDDDCNGLIDDGAPREPCDPAGAPGGLVYQDTDPDSRCQRGSRACVNGTYTGVCEGGVGPLTQEFCNNVDDDCDGDVDERDGGTPLPGEGVPDCGTDVGKCQKGVTECVGGTIVCGGTAIGPDPVELCDGIDGDCDGVDDSIDDLGDAPANPHCWTEPGTTCSHGDPSTTGVSWDPPTGADCDGLGALSTPCSTGTLACLADRWVCQNDTTPIPEICDGLDNDCSGEPDDGALGAPIGDDCGIETGECSLGVNVCDAGVISCSGQGPVPELCDGLDNDCDGNPDNGLSLGDTCAATYDVATYPGDRTQGECEPGLLQCDASSPTGFVCIGGVGPQPEVCDGKDNDCDGSTDESGPAPDGIDGTADPLDLTSPPRLLGDPCGTEEGLCLEGQLGCVNGAVICVGGVGAQVETCDCADNDCDGSVDEPTVCSPGKTCVDTGTYCFCLEPCGGGEFPCPTGSECQQLPRSDSRDVGSYCVTDPCGDCSTRTIRVDNVIQCAPAGSVTGAEDVPECVCKGSAGCQGPCFQVACPDGQACVPTGPALGECQPQNDCYFFGCDAGELCSSGACVDDPCQPNPCGAAEVCKPNDTRTEPRCVATCADVSCSPTERCVEGSCVATGCSAACPAGELCQSDGADGFECGATQCDTTTELPCADGAWCDPATGACGDAPCTGVVCPADQECTDGECVAEAPVGTGGQGGQGGQGAGAAGPNGGATGNGGSGNGSGGDGNTGNTEPEPRGAWGLATGGGGCACSTLPTHGTPFGAALALIAGLALERRRRRRPAREEASAARTVVAGGAR